MQVDSESASRIVGLGRDEALLFGEIIADGFHDDPVCNWVFNGPAAIEPFFTMLARDTYLPTGFGQRTADGPGVTLWIPPGSSPAVGTWTGLKSILLAFRHGGLTSRLLKRRR
jgi:hypothetical protein